MRVVRCWNRLPREAVATLSLEVVARALEQPDLVGGIPTHRWSLSQLPTQTVLYVVEHL